MSYSIIVAKGINNEIGKNNKLIWNLPGDLRFFKETTTGSKIIMGRKTFESLPRLLPNRKHIVLSSSKTFCDEVTVFKTLDELLHQYNNSEEEMFVIGGSSIYRMFIDYCNKMYITEINATDKDADTFFPTFDSKVWEKEVLGENNDNNISYKHVLYKKKGS